MDVRFKNVGICEYIIYDIFFNILSLHDIGHPFESPLVIGTLVPLDPLDNQTCFVYAGPDCPTYQVLKAISNYGFSCKIDYLSKPSFICYYFAKCKW